MAQTRSTRASCRTVRRWLSDHRSFPVISLAGMLILAMPFVEADLDWREAGATLGAALATQRLWTRPGQRFAWRSALTTGLLLCLLLRAEVAGAGAAAAVIGINAKFLLRRGTNRLAFHPALVGLATMASLGGTAHIAAGYWGTAAFLTTGLGLGAGLAWYRPGALAAAVSFLLWYAGLRLGAAGLFEDSPAATFAQLQSTTLLIFGFHLVTDTKTIPGSIAGRLAYALVVAAGAAAIGAWAAPATALLISMISCGAAVPMLERLLPAPAPRWSGSYDPRIAGSPVLKEPHQVGGS